MDQDAVPIVGIGREVDWVERQCRRFLAEWGDRRFVTAPWPISPLPPQIVIATDDIRSSSLASILQECRATIGQASVVLLYWDEPVHLSLVLPWAPGRAHWMPAEVVAARRSLNLLVAPEVSLECAPPFDLPAVLSISLTLLTSRAGKPSGPPPPRTVAALARELSVSRRHLSATAAALKLSWPEVCRLCAARWLLLRVQSAGAIQEGLVHQSGFSDSRSLRRFLAVTLRSSWQECLRFPVQTLDDRIRGALQGEATQDDRSG